MGGRVGSKPRDLAGRRFGPLVAVRVVGPPQRREARAVMRIWLAGLPCGCESVDLALNAGLTARREYTDKAARAAVVGCVWECRLHNVTLTYLDYTGTPW